MELWRNRPVDTIELADGLSFEDNWFATGALDGGTLAIGEPAYYQCTWMYLISDGDQSLLWDTGSGHAPIAPVLARHGRARRSAFPSHLHFDHLGNIAIFDEVYLADLPMVRAISDGASVTPPEHMYFGSYENLAAPTFEVAQWAAPGDVISVGQRRLEVVHTPGHSPDSVSLWEPQRCRFYAGDLIYRSELYGQLPGSSLPDYADTLRRLLTLLPQDVTIMGAHGQEEGGRFDIPSLTYGDLEALLSVIETVLSGPVQDGEHRVNAYMTLLYAAASFGR